MFFFHIDLLSFSLSSILHLKLFSGFLFPQHVHPPSCNGIGSKCKPINGWNNRWNNLAIIDSFLNLSWLRPLSYRNQLIDLLCKLMDWFLYDNGLRHERVKVFVLKITVAPQLSGLLF